MINADIGGSADYLKIADGLLHFATKVADNVFQVWTTDGAQRPVLSRRSAMLRAGTVATSRRLICSPAGSMETVDLERRPCTC